MKIYRGSPIFDPKNIKKVEKFYELMWLVCIYFGEVNFGISNPAINLEAIISFHRCQGKIRFSLNTVYFLNRFVI